MVGSCGWVAVVEIERQEREWEWQWRRKEEERWQTDRQTAERRREKRKREEEESGREKDGVVEREVLSWLLSIWLRATGSATRALAQLAPVQSGGAINEKSHASITLPIFILSKCSEVAWARQACVIIPRGWDHSIVAVSAGFRSLLKLTPIEFRKTAESRPNRDSWKLTIVRKKAIIRSENLSRLG